MKNNIYYFLCGTGIWYIIEFIFRALIGHCPPVLITCCIAGFALVLVNIFSNYNTNALWSSFGTSIIITCSEYLLGYSYWLIFSKRLWDYRGMFMNIHGFICLKYSLIWWIMSFILILIFKIVKQRRKS